MDKLNRSKLKDAKKLYQSGNYHASHELIQEILISDPKNYNAIVLDGACCDRLDMEEVGMDLFHLATQIQPDNSMAWQGLLQLGRKNMDRYYETLVCTCLKLLHFYSE
ncbi:unnamed protein product [Dicrocoelium dendriticum]|nr:unnamed protein product [Dicrocoelium dendriticum]